jgi:hypothetical protein
MIIHGMAQRQGSGLILCCRAKEQDPGSYTKGEPGAPPHPLSPIRLEGEEKSTGLKIRHYNFLLWACGVRLSSYANIELAHYPIVAGINLIADFM